MSFQTKHGTVGATVPRVLSSRWHGGCFVSLVLGSDRDETSTPPASTHGATMRAVWCRGCSLLQHNLARPDEQSQPWQAWQ